MIKNDNHLQKQLKKDEDELVNAINDSFDKLEQSFSFTTPELNWFEQKIAEQKKQIQKKWRQDLLLFSAIAVVILSLMFTTMFQKPILFLALQGGSILFMIGYTSYEFQKKGELKNHD